MWKDSAECRRIGRYATPSHWSRVDCLALTPLVQFIDAYVCYCSSYLESSFNNDTNTCLGASTCQVWQDLAKKVRPTQRELQRERVTFIIFQLLGDNTPEDLPQPIHCNADDRQNDDDHFVNIPGTLEVCHSLFADLFPFLQKSQNPLNCAGHNEYKHVSGGGGGG